MSESPDPADITSTRPSLAQLQPLMDDALRQFGISAVKLKNLRYYNNATYRVSASNGQEYVLRVTSNYYSEAQLRAEMQWLHAMQNDPLLYVPAPVAAPDGRWVIAARAEGLGGPRHCTLFRWMEGTSVGEERLTAAHLRRVGAATAHQLRPRSCRLPCGQLPILQG